MGDSKNDNKTPMAKRSFIKKASPDDIVYKLGYIVGVKSLKRSSSTTKGKSSSSEPVKPTKLNKSTDI